ncbi:MAG: pseudouridine synthase [Hyphomicrobiales bacterium]
MNLTAPSGPPPPIDYAPPQDPYLPVLHADDHLIVVDKSSGLLSVPGKAAEHFDCVEYRAQKQFSDARIVHRLDKDTSGIMVLARGAAAHRHLGLQFERRKVHKRYIARVWGAMEDDQGEVNLPLICDWPNRPKQMVDHERGKNARTQWHVLEREVDATRVLLLPHTGRSHQLRVHMLNLGHPILGDVLYAHAPALNAAERLQLHAESLSLHHPANGTVTTFTANCPF